jgi:hypothetical protein
MGKQQERRWLVVVETGQHSTIGRHTDPTEEDISHAASQLDGAGLAGWLVVSEGHYYQRTPVTLLMVRQITAKPGDWPAAERLWHQRREGSIEEA